MSTACGGLYNLSTLIVIEEAASSYTAAGIVQ